MNRGEDAGVAHVASVRDALRRLPPARRYVAAVSGGCDSLALLHALATRPPGAEPAPVAAVHVHHGLHPQADAWAEHCREACSRLDVTFRVLRVDARAREGESPEAAARRARYEALAAHAMPGDVVCAAHHRRDQAETLLLQLMRGAGPRGLAGMPALAPLGAGWLARPFLDLDPETLRGYLTRAHVEWIEDPSNRDLRIDRNYVRHEILPRLEARWPAALRTLAGAASRQAEASRLVESLGRIDAYGCRGSASQTLSCAALARLPAARARGVVREWLRGRGLPVPGRARTDAILRQVAQARADATPLTRWPGVEVRRYRGELHAGRPLPAHDGRLRARWDPEKGLALDHGRLVADEAVGRGLSARLCAQRTATVRFRRGGERCRPCGRRHSQTLKRLLQEHGVPPWLRDRVPLVYLDGELAAVAGLWVCEGYQAGPDEAGWILRWEHGGAEADEAAGR